MHHLRVTTSGISKAAQCTRPGKEDNNEEAVIKDDDFFPSRTLLYLSLSRLLIRISITMSPGYHYAD